MKKTKKDQKPTTISADSDTSKQIQVPSPSSFSEFKTKLEKDDRKDYRESGFNRLFEKRFRRFMKD